MPGKIPFGPETIVIQRHTQYSIQATDGSYYRVNEPLTLLHFVDGMTYSVQGSVSTKGNKYISTIEGGPPQAVAQPSVQPGLPPLPPAPPPTYAPPVVASPIPQPPPPTPAPKASPPPFKGHNVEGKVSCVMGAGLFNYLASVTQNDTEFMAKYQQLLPQIIEFHRSKGWI